MRPMMTGCPVVIRLKCFMSSGRCHGMVPSLPMTPDLVCAQIMPMPVILAAVSCVKMTPGSWAGSSEEGALIPRSVP